MSPDEVHPPAARTGEPAPGGAAFWTAVAIGWASIGFGLAQLVLDGGPRRVLDVGTWVVGLDLAHDLLLAPAATAVAIGVLGLVPRGWRAPILWGLGTTVVVLLLAWPLLGGHGRTGNPTELPLDYPTAVATVLGVVYGLVAGWFAVLAWRVRRRRPARNPDRQPGRGLSADATGGPDCAA